MKPRPSLLVVSTPVHSWLHHCEQTAQKMAAVKAYPPDCQTISFFRSLSTLTPRPRTCLPWSRGCRYCKWSPVSALCIHPPTPTPPNSSVSPSQTLIKRKFASDIKLPFTAILRLPLVCFSCYFCIADHNPRCCNTSACVHVFSSLPLMCFWGIWCSDSPMLPLQTWGFWMSVQSPHSAVSVMFFHMLRWIWRHLL